MAVEDKDKNNFLPNVFIDITPFMDKKLEQVILSAFESVNCCSLYNQCDGNCIDCFFDHDTNGFVFSEALSNSSKNIESTETANNTAMFQLLCDVEHAIRNGLSYSVTRESNLYKNIVEAIAQQKHS